MSNLDELKAAKAEIAKLKKETAKKVKSIFYSSVKELFNNHPQLKKISFTCYTPYFNDGDTCEFSSHHAYADINDMEEGSDYPSYHADDEDAAKKAWEAIPKDERKALVKAVGDFMKHWDDDDIYDLFGDHARVIITKKGIKVDSYEHD